MPRPSSSPTTCAATWTAGRCGLVAIRRAIARQFVRRHAAAVAAGLVLLLALVAGSPARRPGWSSPAATAIAPRNPRDRPDGRSTGSSPASARSGCSTSRGCTRSARTCSRTPSGSTRDSSTAAVTPRSAPSWPRRGAGSPGSPPRSARRPEAVEQFEQADRLWDDLVRARPATRITGRTWPRPSTGWAAP